jgi:hypothetical protein
VVVSNRMVLLLHPSISEPPRQPLIATGYNVLFYHWWHRQVSQDKAHSPRIKRGHQHLCLCHVNTFESTRPLRSTKPKPAERSINKVEHPPPFQTNLLDSPHLSPGCLNVKSTVNAQKLKPVPFMRVYILQKNKTSGRTPLITFPNSSTNI